MNEEVHSIRAEINRIKKEPNSPDNKRRIRKLYHELDEIQFQPDYMCLIIDKNKHYYRACKGFSINGVEYKRLLGTNGGIKMSTIVFVSTRLHDELQRRIENGRDKTKPLVTAKLEAYRALTCSASTPVSMPKGILVVHDAETSFTADIVALANQQHGQPVMRPMKDQQVTIDATDGCGMMLPSLAERWSRQLGLDYMVSAVNTRFSFEKGVVFTFDFVDFAEKVAGSYIVHDVWGNEVDVRNVQLVLTESMVKLWDSYKSCDDYISNSISNHYTFAVTKTAPETLENERTLNYQFIQSFDLSDDDIDELISYTKDEFVDVLGNDWRKTILFTKGSWLNAENVARMDDPVMMALMIDHNLANDPHIVNVVHDLIRNRIDEAKVGVLKVHGNYSIISGDLYGLCQNMFGLPVTGILKAGQIYNEYWEKSGSDHLLCFRAPMTAHENIRAVTPSHDEDAKYWFRYIHTCTIFNSWDTMMASLNGADFDGDIVMITDNPVLVRKHVPLPTIMCEQHKADKRISTQEDFVRSNVSSFGNDIGKITNRVTSMYEVRSHFKKGSRQYETLNYRIRCGQLLQQDAIDKAKGIISKPMPREWYDTHSVYKIQDDEKRSFYREIVADRKPYFMRYVYPQLKKQYRTYQKNADMNALREFDMTVPELLQKPFDELTDEQVEFLRYYRADLPVGTGDCVMNIICRKFEDEFDGWMTKTNAATTFDYTVLKSDAPYTTKKFYEIKRLYEEYNHKVQQYKVFMNYERVDKYDAVNELRVMNREFRRECYEICPNEDSLCNIVLDLCYKRTATKKFAWDMCGNVIVKNLLRKNNYTVQFPEMCADGDIQYCGNKFKITSTRIEVDDNDNTEIG